MTGSGIRKSSAPSRIRHRRHRGLRPAESSPTCPQRRAPRTRTHARRLGRALEAALDRVVDLDPDTRASLRALDGRAMTLEFRTRRSRCASRSTAIGSAIGPAFGGDSALRVTAAPSRCCDSRSRAVATMRSTPGSVDVSGDADLARRLERIAKNFEPDFDEAFVRAFGDVAGFQIARGVRRALAGVRDGPRGRSRAMRPNICHEEGRDRRRRRPKSTCFSTMSTRCASAPTGSKRASGAWPARGKPDRVTPLRQVPRLLRIGAVLVRYRLDDLVDAAHLYRPLKLVRVLLPRPRGDIAHATRGARLVMALTELGPIFVKFGQILSTRRDLLPPDVADELTTLQDRVAPFPESLARAAIESALGAPIAVRFGVIRRHAARVGLDRAGARGDAAGRTRGRRQGAAAGHRGAHRGRCRSFARDRRVGRALPSERRQDPSARHRRRDRDDADPRARPACAKARTHRCCGAISSARTISTCPR